MRIPFLDLQRQYDPIRDEIRAAIDEVCDAQAFILGPKVVELEAQIAAYCQADFACGVSSGSDALLIALMAEGIGPGDEVITSPYTFFATAGAIRRVGATPVFVDIDPVTFNLNPDLIEDRITPRTKGIIPIHLFGQPADMDAVVHLARRHHVCIIEDTAQAIGTEYKDRRVGAIGDYGCISFFPSKNLGAFGDAGMVVTNDPDRHHHLSRLRVHGGDPKYYHKCVGGNFRLDALQATVLLVKLKYLDDWTAARRRNADRYRQLFADSAIGDDVTLPDCADYCTRHIYSQFCIRLPANRRDRIWRRIQKNGVGCEVYYPVPLHLQECFADLGGGAGDFPESERAARETLALPVYSDLTDGEMQYVVQQIATAWNAEE